MDTDELYEVENLLSELERYEYPHIKQRVLRIKEIMQYIFDNEKDKEFKKKGILNIPGANIMHLFSVRTL